MTFISDFLETTWFVHAVTLEPASPPENIDEDDPSTGWGEPVTLTPCRLQDINVQQLQEARLAGVQKVSYVLLIPLGTYPDEPIPKNSKISGVVYKAGNPRAGQVVDEGPFEVVGYLTQRSFENEYHQLLLDRFS